MRFSFGDVLLDTDRFLLERTGEPVHVQPQVFEVLSHLVLNRDRVVPKTELLDTVWGDRFVSESTLTSRIKAARRSPHGIHVDSSSGSASARRATGCASPMRPSAKVRHWCARLTG